ncbi:ADP-ribosylation factor-binding protein GGA1-like [Homarus americanus]|uniref:ADP-ribosylation factor-binding protein GGA1-like n=1 Tax=Homarus americanus TaxID=6706 RepID=A0A8J5JZV9_HOMAM|nr:ADP-ribosylation factor-binding protein GGA1-like [Homarus americanus]
METVTIVGLPPEKSTSPLNIEDDPNSIQAVCQAVTSESGGVQTAVRLLAHKIQSPQEREALQALSVLQACVNNCGTTFHTEIGKFRFLNEMIKLVSPKYLGNHTHTLVKTKVVELLYTWTIDLKAEPKILEAYNMLKKQGVVKDDPQYIGAPCVPEPRSRANAVFEDEEKSRLLQRLLQSKNPEDLHKANALIKSMVKEDERRMERTSRRIVEVETAMNNVRVLDEMLSRHQESPATQADLDLMLELHSSCSSLRSNLYRLVSEMDDKEEGIGDLLKANDELSRVMGRYKLIIEGTKVENQSGEIENQHQMDAGGGVVTQKDGLDGLNLGHTNPAPVGAPATDNSASLLDDLGGIFSGSAVASATAPNLQLGPPLHTAMAPTLVPQTSPGNRADAQSKERTDPLDELAALGTSLIKQNLPANAQVQVQFKPAEKLSMNQLKQQQQSVNIAASSVNVSASLLPTKNTSSGSLNTPQFPAGVSLATGAGSNSISRDSVDSLLNIDLLSGDIGVGIIPDETKISITTTIDKVKPLDDSNLLDSHDDSLLEAPSPNTSVEITNTKKQSQENKKNVCEDSERRTNSISNAQFMEVKPMTDIKVTLESIKPGRQGSVIVMDSNDVSVTLHFTENQPRDDVSVVVVSTVSRNLQPISNYVLQAVVPKGCKVRLQPPSSTDLAAYSPFLPPPAITQIMLIANPNKLNVSLKVMLSYSLEEDPVTEMGEVASLPL